MTDAIPVPSADTSIMSVEQVLDIERKLRENRAAQHRGEVLPHIVTKEEMRAAVQAIRRQRGTMELTAPTSGGKKGAKGKASIISLDLDGL